MSNTLYSIIKSNYTITEAAAAIGVAITKGDTKNGGGREACPFCSSTTAFVTYQNKTYRCYSCKNAGDVIDLAKSFNKLNLLNKGLDVVLRVEGNRKDSLREVFECYKKALVKFEYLISGPLETMIERGLHFDVETIGYAPYNNYLQEQGFKKKTLEDLGLISNSGKEIWYNHIIFPIQDQYSYVRHLQGRAVGEEVGARWLGSRGGLRPISDTLYGLEKLPFNKQQAAGLPDIFITEGITDTQSLRQLTGTVRGRIKGQTFTKAVSINAIGTLSLTPDLTYYSKVLENYSLCFIYDNTKAAIGRENGGSYISWNSVLPSIVSLQVKRGKKAPPIYCLPVPEEPGVEDVNDYCNDIEWSVQEFYKYVVTSKKRLEDFLLELYKNDASRQELVAKSISVYREPKHLEQFETNLKTMYGSTLNYILDTVS